MGIPSPTPITYNAVQVPRTPSVRCIVDPGSSTFNQNLLRIDIRVLGAKTRTEIKALCSRCQKREGNRTTPSLINFHSKRDILDARNGKVRIDFTFSCYPRDHEEQYYLYVLFGNSESCH